MAFDFPSGVDLDDGYQVINPETGATYRWKEDPGKWVLVTPLSSAAGRRPIFAPSEPSEHPDYNAPDSNLQIGDIWYDTSDELAQHIWDGGEWVAVDGRYVEVKGDVMTGPLLMNDGDALDPQPLVIDADDQAVHKIYVDSLKAHIYVGEQGPDTTDLPIGTLWYDNDENDLTLYLWTGKEWTTAAPPVSTDGAVVTLQGEVEQALAAANRADNRSASNQSSIIEIARVVGSIQDGLGQVTLQEVLDNGNIADQGILLTDAQDALVAIAPNEALIDIASDTSKKNPSIRLTHIDKLNFPDSQAQIELDGDGTRVDFEFNQAINDVHFKFDDQEKLVLNKEGDAEFTGRVKVSPGITGNEVATVNQLNILQDEIEQLRPTLARGLWQYQKIWPSYLENNPPTAGLYSLMGGELSVQDQKDRCDAELLQCQIDNAGDPIAGQQCTRDHQACYEQAEANGTTPNWVEAWEEVTNIFIAGTDLNGVKHFFTDDEIKGKYVEFFNTDDDSYGLFKVLNYGALFGGDLQFYVELVQAKGAPNGTASFQIFDLDDDLSDDVGNFVRKTGDEMSGTLDMQFNAIENAGKFEHEIVEVLTSNTKRAEDIYMFQREGKGEVFLGLNGTVWLPSMNGTIADAGGQNIPWDNVEIGDYIKAHENGHSSTRYSIYGPVTKKVEVDLDGYPFYRFDFENHHAVIHGPEVIRVGKYVTLTRVEVSGKESNIITDFGGEIHGRLIIRHPGASPLEIHASDLGNNYSGSGIQIYGVNDKKLVEIDSGDGKLKCHSTDGGYMKASSNLDVVTRGFLFHEYGEEQTRPAGFNYTYKKLNDAADIEEGKATARKRGNMAYVNNSTAGVRALFINLHDYYQHININPYYDDGTTFTVDDDLVEDLSEPPEAATTADGEHFIDYQGLGMRQFLSLYSNPRGGKPALARIYYITGVTFYKNDPFIKADVSTWKSLQTVYYEKMIVHMPGII